MVQPVHACGYRRTAMTRFANPTYTSSTGTVKLDRPLATVVEVLVAA
jgi:hypothetical protein